MTGEFDQSTNEERPSGKPCIALMGEFSAGKSTLSNLLIGTQSLPVQVTATQLPPVWISEGDKPPYRVDLDGNIQPVDLNQLGAVDVADTAYVRIYRQSETLKSCDIIDMPGISDPSMAADVWQRVIHHATGVIWCTHATQAWRQSEAAVWDGMPPDLHEKSLLLITRMDKITSENDRVRLLRRVMKETEGLFAEVVPIALLDAIEGKSDPAKWEASGAAYFTDKLRELVVEGATTSASGAKSLTERPADALAIDEAEDALDIEGATVAAGTVMPSRVVPRQGIRPRARRSERPQAQPLHAS